MTSCASKVAFLPLGSRPWRGFGLAGAGWRRSRGSGGDEGMFGGSEETSFNFMLIFVCHYPQLTSKEGISSREHRRGHSGTLSGTARRK